LGMVGSPPVSFNARKMKQAGIEQRGSERYYFGFGRGLDARSMGLDAPGSSEK
jgi:hypothetical protein